MLFILFKHKYLLSLTALFLFLSILCQIFPAVTLRSLLRQSGNMQTTENKFLKKCRLKYISRYKLNGKVPNTAVFVDKSVRGLRFCGITLSKYSQLSGQFILFSILCTGIMICTSLSAGDTLFQIIPYYLISMLELYLYFSISALSDLAGQKKRLQIELEDYLENHLLPSLEAEQSKSPDTTKALPAEPSSADKADSLKESSSERSFNKQDLSELELLLKELLA